jgi:hypothetical protein
MSSGDSTLHRRFHPIRPLSSGQASVIDFLTKKVNAFGGYWHTVAGFIF